MPYGLSSYVVNKFVDQVLRGQSALAPATLYVGLLTANQGVYAISTVYPASSYVVALTSDGTRHLYYSAAGGTSSGTAPTFPGLIGETVVDNTVVWIEQSIVLKSNGAAVAEPTIGVGNYARVPIASTLANWSGTQGPMTTAASSGTSGQISTNVELDFAAPTAAWATAPAVVWAVALFDAATGGNLIGVASVSAPSAVGSGIAPVISASALRVSFFAPPNITSGIEISLSNYFVNKLLDQVFRGQATLAPATVYVTLSTATKGIRGNSMSYTAGDTMTVLASDGLYHLYAATIGGTSASTPPTFPGHPNETIADGSVTWVEQTAALAANTNVNEPTIGTNGYARVAVTSSLAHWAGTQGPGTTAVSSGTYGETSNNSAVTFPSSTGAWISSPAIIWGIAIYDAATGGNLLVTGPISDPQTVTASGIAPSFAIGTIGLTFDAPYVPPPVPSIVLMHFDGANGSTTFTDVYGHTFGVLSGTPTLSTAQAKFGPSSLLVASAASDSISSGASPDFAFGTGDFTIEAWVYLNSIPSSIVNAQIAGCWENSPARHWQFLIGNTYIVLGLEGSYGTSGTITPVTGSWHHYAAVRLGGTVTLYYDGVAVCSYASAANVGYTTLAIGRDDDTATWYLDGYIDELRVSNVARYSANFTPPTAPFAY